MVLCEFVEDWSFPYVWALVVASGWIFVMGFSSSVFYALFWKPSFELWQKKSNPKYPPVEKVREEIMQMNKGLIWAALPAALAIYSANIGWGRGYCGSPGHSWYTEFLIQAIFWFTLDLLEFLYHSGTHVFKFLWQFHRYHHTFYNPSPFAVIADEVVDQLARGMPMFIFPLFVPINIDIMLLQMAITSYGYGTYLHCGHELDYPDAHHPILNTSFQHYCHHAVSVINKPYHCGFWLRIFDRICGTVYTKECFCAKCARGRGERSVEKWREVVIPDYSKLLSFSFWKEGLALEYQKLRKGEWMRVY